MNLLLLGSKGEIVTLWQDFLISQGLYAGPTNGTFDAATDAASKEFQKKHNLPADGVVGTRSIAVATQNGLKLPVEKPVDPNDKTSPNWPAKPSYNALYKTEERMAIFGNFEYKSAPVPNNPENVEILGTWIADNIIKVDIPQMAAFKAPTKVIFHKKAAPQLIALWAAWEKAGLLPLVKSWAGTFVPRFVRGSTTLLSNHSFGTAFDINVPQNGLGVVPALVGQPGSVRELVPIANELGFYWGGHFPRYDGMHFEVAKIL